MNSFSCFFFPLLSVMFFYAPAQNNADQLALSLLNNKEFDKAEIYLEKLYRNDPLRWFHPYFQALTEQKKFDQAEKLCKSYQKISQPSPVAFVYIAQIYKRKENRKKWEDYNQKAIRLTGGQEFLVHQTAEAFKKFEEWEWAIKTYDEGAAKNPNYPFYYEKAEVYKLWGNLRMMINAYLDAVEFRETEIYNAQMHLANSLGYDEHSGGFKNPILKEELLKRIQQKSSSVVLVDFLIYVLNQQKDFYAAFVQAKALDKRLNENGARVFQQARICLENDDLSTATLCLDYILSLPSTPYREQAEILKGELLFKKIYSVFFPKEEEIQNTIAYHENLLKKYSLQNPASYSEIIIRLASLYVDFRKDYAGAIRLLEPQIGQQAIPPICKARIKMKLADVLLQNGNLWDASLLYGQIDKDFKHDNIGFEAKFRNAKIFFYSGEFRLAKSQADVLMGSTSKLTANDAMELSLIISDGLGSDSLSGPLQYFAHACLLEEGRNYSRALQTLDSIAYVFPENSMPDHILFKKTQLLANMGDFPKAIEKAEEFLKKFPQSIHADDACWMLARLYYEKLQDAARSMSYLETLMNNYPGSVHIHAARNYYRTLRGEQPSQP